MSPSETQRVIEANTEAIAQLSGVLNALVTNFIRPSAEQASANYERLDRIEGVVLSIAEQQQAATQQIAAIAGQQQAITQQIAAIAGQQQTITQQIAAITGQQQAITQQIAAIAGQQQTITQQIAAIAEQQQANMQQIAANAELVTTLRESIEAFDIRLEEDPSASSAKTLAILLKSP